MSRGDGAKQLLLAVAAVALAVCSLRAADADVALAIPDTGQDADAPAGGWCGEAAIQMACLYYGAYIPQKTINKAGSPEHPDLYAQDLGRALEALGFAYEPFRNKDANALAAFIAWIRADLAAGKPVIVGAKINPTQHPEWVCDHFMLAVGAKKNSLVFNTTWRRQEELTHERLASVEKGLSFKNDDNRYFGLVVTGRKVSAAGSKPVGIAMNAEKKDGPVKCNVTISGLEKGKKYTLTSRVGEAVETEAFTAQADTAMFAKTLPRDKPAYFQCMPAPDK